MTLPHRLSNPDADLYYARAERDELLDLDTGESEPPHETATALEARRRASGPAGQAPIPPAPVRPPDPWQVLLEQVQACLDRDDCPLGLRGPLLSVRTFLSFPRFPRERT